MCTVSRSHAIFMYNTTIYQIVILPVLSSVPISIEDDETHIMASKRCKRNKGSFKAESILHFCTLRQGEDSLRIRKIQECMSLSFPIDIFVCPSIPRFQLLYDLSLLFVQAEIDEPKQKADKYLGGK